MSANTPGAASPVPHPDTDLAGDSIGGAPAGYPVGRQGGRVDIDEVKAWSISGYLPTLVAVLALAAGIYAFFRYEQAEGSSPQPPMIIAGIAGVLIFVVITTGLTVISPGRTMVIQFFGQYMGTVRRSGLVMSVPFAIRTKVSVRVRNFETNELKVNDSDGNPVNIAAIIVWQVADTAKSIFAVENFTEFVAMQSEAALRHVAGSHPYDNAGVGEETLRGSTEVVSRELAEEVAERIAIAGLEVVEVRISSLAYAPEIAQVMLQRQQASAVIAAREKIVEGAVSMVNNALERLEEQQIVSLDDERKAAMVSNLLVVLCSDSHVTPVVNAGSLY